MEIYFVLGIMGALLVVIVFALYVHDRELREQIKGKEVATLQETRK
jgi:hypothetical protein